MGSQRVRHDWAIFTLLYNIIVHYLHIPLKGWLQYVYLTSVPIHSYKNVFLQMKTFKVFYWVLLCTDGQHRNQDWIYSLQPKMEKLYTVSKNKTGSWLWLRLWTPSYWKFKLKLKKVGKTTRPFSYDLNQIPYNYTVEVTDRFQGLDLIGRVPEELWTEVHDIVQEAVIKTIPRKRNTKRQNGCLRRSYKELRKEKVKVKLLSHVILCDRPHGLYSPPDSSIYQIFQARVLQWVAIYFSRGSFWPRDWTCVSRIAGRCFTVWATAEAPRKEEKLKAKE